MKVIRYEFLSDDGNFYGAEVDWSETNEAIAAAEAHNGEYEIVDDGRPDSAPSGDSTAVWDELDAAYQEGVDSV